MAALAFDDEHSPIGDLQVAQAQTQHLAAAQPAEQHRLDHRPIPPRPQRPPQSVDLDRGQDLGSVRGTRTSGTVRDVTEPA